MDIKVLGPGCAKCHQLEASVKQAVKEMGLDAKVDVVRDIIKIMEYPILTTPGLVLNGKLVSSGRALTKTEVIDFINKNMA
jgi:small redox-active disulfide protein 2